IRDRFSSPNASPIARDTSIQVLADCGSIARPPMIATIRMITAAFACAILAHGTAHAQRSEACKPEKLSDLKMVDFNAAFAAANKRAHVWQPDVVVVRLTQTALGPIDPEARSATLDM